MMTRRDALKRMMAVAAAASVRPAFARPDATGYTVPEGYSLVWHDEFNIDGRPNPRNWNYELGFVRNEEFQWYRPQNAFCSGGDLIIESRREVIPNPYYIPGSNDWRFNRPTAQYTSASLTTRGLHSWLYGFFVMRGRIDTRSGIWPAWWMIGTSKPWPASGEIDIMEYYTGHVNANVAWQNPNGSPHWVTTFRPIVDFHNPNWPNEFHTWAMEWTLAYIHLYLDGALMTAVNLSETHDARYGDFNPFHQPMFMILNQAVGGNAGGNPAHTRFPTLFEVDYVRVYQQRS